MKKAIPLGLVLVTALTSASFSTQNADNQSLIGSTSNTNISENTSTSGGTKTTNEVTSQKIKTPDIDIDLCLGQESQKYYYLILMP